MQEWKYLHLCSCSNRGFLHRAVRLDLLACVPLLLAQLTKAFIQLQHFLHTASHFCRQ